MALHCIAIGSVKVPEVDRSKADAKNIIAIVLEEVDGMYKLGTEKGRIAALYTRNQILACKQKFLSFDSVPDKEISLRSAAIAMSLGSGQGFFRCGCEKKCVNNLCKCRANKVLCNSKCHGSSSCISPRNFFDIIIRDLNKLHVFHRTQVSLPTRKCF